MRAIVGAAPGASVHDHWAFHRDSGQRAAVPSEVKAFADVHAPMPPSRAHLARLRRDRKAAFAHHAKPAPRPVDPCVAFMKAQSGKLSQLLGHPDAWVAPTPPERPVYGPKAVERPLTPEQRETRLQQRFRLACERAAFGTDEAVAAFRLYVRG